MKITNLTSKIYALIIILFIFSFSNCTKEKDEVKAKPKLNYKSVWYKQAQVDLGARIKMISPQKGFAASRGRGDVEGSLNNFDDDEWTETYSYPYSDNPLIQIVDKNRLWFVHHLTHAGNYKPVFNEFDLKDTSRTEIPLPKVMWDETDYVMWKDLTLLDDGTAWMVGQQGNILFYNGEKWKSEESPINKNELESLLSGDLNSVFFLNKNSGWAVGKDGIILRYKNNKWQKFPSPTDRNLSSIYMIDENFGWIVGNGGLLLRFNGSEWIKGKLEAPENFTSIDALDKNNVWVTGHNSSLYYYNGKEWRQDESVKVFEDAFTDIDVLKDDDGKIIIWLIGNEGIYTNSQSLGFSFSNYTNQSALRRTGKAGVFFDRDNDYTPDLIVMNEEGPSLLYQNNGKGIFSEVTLDAELLNSPNEVNGIAIGDVNNDGLQDIFHLFNTQNSELFVGTSGGKFKNFTKESEIKLEEVDSYLPASARFADFNLDGNLDLYISNFDYEDMLFKNDGAGIFKNIFNETNIEKETGLHSFGASFSDFNNDGLVDILIPYNIPANNQIINLFINKGNFNFENKPVASFIIKGDYSIQSTIALSNDYNNDGSTDILVLSQKSHPRLFINDGNADFKDVSQEAGFTETVFHPEHLNGIANAGDVNNDGYIDVFITSKLFLNSKDLKFKEVSEQVGIDFTGNPSFADTDNDGDLDLFIGSSRRALGKGDRAIFYRNNLNDNNFVKFRVNGDRSNRSGIGTKIFLSAYNENGNEIYKNKKEVGFGNSPLVQQYLSEIHFGMNPGYNYKAKIIFPLGITKEVNNIERGKIYEIKESSFPERTYILTQKSILRTIKLINRNVFIVKLFILLLLLMLIVNYGIKTGAQSFVKKWYFISSLVFLFVLFVHLTIMQNYVIKNFAPFIVVIVIGVASVIIAGAIIRKRKARFISHYKIEEQIGKGGMGTVYKAVDTSVKKMAALKILNEEMLKDEENKKRFSGEGQLLSSFEHPNIVKVFEIGETEGKGFIAMEYLTGGTLKDHIDENHPLSIEEIKRIALQVCSGLQEIHKKGIVHRDIKTNNIMLDENKNIRIMDFGLSKSPLVSTMTSLGTVLGTLGYVAPEQVTNVMVDERTDIFSFGVVLYELCTNNLPFKGDNEIALIHSIFNTTPQLPSKINEDVPADLDEIIMKCIAKEPDERFETVEKIINEIGKIEGV